MDTWERREKWAVMGAKKKRAALAVTMDHDEDVGDCGAEEEMLML